MILGKRIGLKLIEQHEVPVIHGIMQVPQVREQLMWDDADLIPSRVVGLLTGNEPTARAFGIWRIDTKGLVGLVTLNHYQPVHRSAVVGMFAIHPSVGEGIWGASVETMKLMGSYCFETLGLNRVTGMCWADNRIAATLYKRCGFYKEGTLRQESWRRGQWVDKHVYSMLLPEFRAWKAKWRKPGGCDGSGV